ncbi:ABC transporter permease [Halieaceae bacterium IMCC14734]|uniref:ABC transporter permease n=2 Tax=Candidatus Litorirhabdus singularis TaxID=2518993 RepID=A0ABT3TB97_9GAMM|nr:ABC transporter permease [Candidatus Litorirhabdus singularis]
MIFMNAMMRGMIDGMVDTGITMLPGHAQVHHRDYLDDPSVVNSIAALSPAAQQALENPDIEAWSARVRVPAIISSERDNRGVILLGVDPAQELGVGFDSTDLLSGRFLESVDDTGLVVGASLLEKLETVSGRRVVLMSQDPDNEVAERGFRIVGVYEADTDAQEERFVYAGRAVVQAMLKMGPEVSEIAIVGNGYRDLGAWLPELRAALTADYQVKDWRELDGYLEMAVNIQDGFVVILAVIIFVVLSFGLVNTMVMAVFERIREIGLMLALGMRPATILSQILLEGLILLSIGLLLGNGLAVLSILPLQSGIDLSGIADAAEMAGMATTLYPVLHINDMLLSSVVVLVLGLLSTLLPAWRASRFDPITALNKN